MKDEKTGENREKIKSRKTVVAVGRTPERPQIERLSVLVYFLAVDRVPERPQSERLSVLLFFCERQNARAPKN